MWRLFWHIAQLSYRFRLVPLVDYFCRFVLILHPEYWFARELPKHARGYYSQNGQDAFIEEFFKKYPPLTKTFVEVGAFDGVHYSNVRRLFEKYGWVGVCIEPEQTNFAKLQYNYKKTPIICIKSAVGAKEGSADLYVSEYPHLPEWGSDVASIHKDGLYKWSNYQPNWHKQTVPLRTLSNILNEVGLQNIDLLSIDVEGNDLAVLQGFNFELYCPMLIIVEYGCHREEMINLLARKNYKLIHDNGQDLFFSIF